jgi:hypothetical protein
MYAKIKYFNIKKLGIVNVLIGPFEKTRSLYPIHKNKIEKKII